MGALGSSDTELSTDSTSRSSPTIAYTGDRLKLTPITSHPAPEFENSLSPCHATCPDVVDQVGSWSLTGPLLQRWFIKTFGGDWRPLRICVCTNLSLSGLPTHGRIHVNFPWSPQQLTKSLIFVHTRRVLFSCITCIPNRL